MSRYIDANKIPYVISEDGCLDDFAYRYDINEVPTADVVEVVRCKDCKRWHKEKNGSQGRCGMYGHYPRDVFYCANGERSENGKS